MLFAFTFLRVWEKEFAWGIIKYSNNALNLFSIFPNFFFFKLLSLWICFLFFFYNSEWKAGSHEHASLFSESDDGTFSVTSHNLFAVRRRSYSWNYMKLFFFLTLYHCSGDGYAHCSVSVTSLVELTSFIHYCYYCLFVCLLLKLLF